MWNQIACKSRPIFTQNLSLLRKNLLHNQSAIKFVVTPCFNQRLFNNSKTYSQCLITSLPKYFHSSSSLLSSTTETSTSTTTSNSTVDLKSHVDIIDNDGKVIIDEKMLNKLIEEMDQRMAEVNQVMQSTGRSQQFKIYGFTLITMIAGVIAGAYAAHLGAWFLDKVGLFIFQEEDDD